MWPTSLTTGFNMHFFSLLVVIFVDYISDYRTWAGTMAYTLASLFAKVGKCTKVIEIRGSREKSHAGDHEANGPQKAWAGQGQSPAVTGRAEVGPKLSSPRSQWRVPAREPPWAPLCGADPRGTLPPPGACQSPRPPTGQKGRLTSPHLVAALRA